MKIFVSLLRLLKWDVAVLLLLLLVGFSMDDSAAWCSQESRSGGEAASMPTSPSEPTTQLHTHHPARWERQVQDAFEPKGVAKIVTVADRLALETYCAGIHTIYVHDSPNLDLRDYVGKFVRVRYHYSKALRHNIRCVRAPCGPIEEVGIVIESIVDTAVSEEEQARYTTTCPEVP
jgi:hypothetical protein